MVSKKTRSTTDEIEASPLSTLIKDEVILVGFLILYVGIVSNDSYYHRFGVKYQLLNLSVSQYRGSILLTYAPLLLIPFALAIGWLVVDRYATKKSVTYTRLRRVGAYLVILLILIIAFKLAVRAGLDQAERDMSSASSSLPRVVRLVTNKEEFGPEDHYRLLMVDGDFIIVFKPLGTADTEAFPLVKRFAKGGIYVLDTSW
jgi:hypothetical protein